MNANPYDSTNVPSEPLGDHVDRQRRDALATAIRQFLREEVTAFKFDASIDPFRDSSDSAVRFVAQDAWLYYDDCDDHLAALNKPTWDYFQRLLLLLESDRRVETVRSRRWSWSQLVAVAALIGFIAISFQVGWGYQTIAVAIPFGLVSIAISWKRRGLTPENPYEPLIYPFATFGDLRSAYESAAFRKMLFPRRLGDRIVRPTYLAFYYWLQFYALWSIVSPAVLAVQALPRTESRVRVTA